jgi:prepilin-type N-terminal cleavage/methylation domain-containing protein
MRNGFSLIELSIVLVILGLLTGGVLTGQNLIRAAELRSITTEFQNYQASVMTFRNKYMALPGDMVNATSFWASAGGTGADAICFAVESTGAETCNGNGDGSIGELGAPSERYRFWQHLANAGLVQGSYT